MPKITSRDRDILDGINIPSLAKDVRSIYSSDSQSNFSRTSQQIKETLGERDPLGESLRKGNSLVDAKTLVSALKDAISERSSYDSVNNDEHIIPGTLSATGMRLSDEEMELLIASLEDQISRVKTKAQKLKDAVIVRQNLSPTVVTFNPDEEDVLKRGMVKVFKHKSNTITFEHYQAALAARQELADMQMKKQLKNSEIIINDRNTQ